MKKTNKKLLSLLLAVLMLTGSIGVGFTVFADDPPHDCATEGHEYEFVQITAADSAAVEEVLGRRVPAQSLSNFNGAVYEDVTYANGIDYFVASCHFRKCKHCGDIQEIYAHKWKGGWQDDDEGSHYIACEYCDIKKNKSPHTDVNLFTDFIDAYGNYSTDGLCDTCGAELDHRYQKSTSTPATCTSAGFDVYSCLNCDDKFNMFTQSPLGHNFSADLDSEYVDVSWGTNHTSCTLTFRCTRDGCNIEPLTYTVNMDSGFTNNIITSAPDASNPTCGTVYTAVFTIDDIQNEGWNSLKNADNTYTFTVEDTVFNHVPGDPVLEDNANPTCSSEGNYDEVVYCSICNEELSRNTIVVDMTAHTPDTPIIENNVEPTCTETGSYDQVVKCSVCGVTLSTNTITVPANGHTPSPSTEVLLIAPTCVSEGKSVDVVYCSVCNQELSRSNEKTIPATGNHYDSDNDGLCDVCGSDHLVHNFYLTNSVDATCTTNGYNEYKCRECEKTYNEETNKNLGHIWDNRTQAMNSITDDDYIKFTTDTTDVKNPSCTVTYTCMRPGCNQTAMFTVYYNDDLNNLGKVSLTNSQTPATCEFGSGIEYTAHFKISDFYFNTDGTPGTLEYDYKFVVEDGKEEALGHDFGEYKVIKEPGCTEEGIEARTCSRCDKVETRAIPAAGHDFSVLVSGTAATCTTPGSGEFKCSKCDETTTTTIPALGHDYKTT
ncbi:MAG: hypothetical protein IKH65_00120, partial [Clostridia bacterium]|nr:hypothetical protein [Clostridia bacterium]